MIAPLAYLLLISFTSSVREGGTKHDTAPLTHRQAEFVLVWIMLKSVLPSVLVVSHSARAGRPSGSPSRGAWARRRRSIPRRPLAALVIAVQQARVQISSLQIHPVHAPHGGSDRPSGIPPTAPVRLSIPPQSPRRRGICTLFQVGHCDVLRDGVPQRPVAPRPRADEDHECRWVGEGGRGEDCHWCCGWSWRHVVHYLGRERTHLCMLGRLRGEEDVS